MFLRYFTGVSPGVLVFLRCFTGVLPVFCQCFTGVFTVFYWYSTGVLPVLYQYFTGVFPVFLRQIYGVFPGKLPRFSAKTWGTIVARYAFCKTKRILLEGLPPPKTPGTPVRICHWTIYTHTGSTPVYCQTHHLPITFSAPCAASVM